MRRRKGRRRRRRWWRRKRRRRRTKRRKRGMTGMHFEVYLKKPDWRGIQHAVYHGVTGNQEV